MNKKNLSLVLAPIMFSALGACATSDITPEEKAADLIFENHIIYDSTQLDGTQNSLFPTPYKDEFKVGDTVVLNILNVADASGNFVVDSLGNVDFPLIGEQRVQGKTVEQVQKELKQVYGADYIVNPTIIVERSALPLGEIVVDGWVARPGIHELTRNITLQKAVAMVGGLKEDADAKTVYVSRANGTERIGLEYNLKGIREGGLTDPVILPGDIIYITSNDRKILFREFIRTAPLITLFLNNTGSN